MPLIDPSKFLEATGLMFRFSLRAVGWAEMQMMSQLRARLDLVTPAGLSVGPSFADMTLDQKLTHLLDRAVFQTAAEGREDVFRQILDNLLPDEARIVEALSDGSHSPLMHVRARNRAGNLGETVLEHACLIGRMANVSLPHMTPSYVSHLLTLGLVEIGPKDSEAGDDYQILQADLDVLKAIKSASHGPIVPKIERHTLKLSPLGHDLWLSCHPTRVRGTAVVDDPDTSQCDLAVEVTS